MAEVLSPRSANIQSKRSTSDTQKEKKHPSPPPKFVIQPPGPEEVLGQKYVIGKELGKGGFAICYEGTINGQKHGRKTHKFALKIVKAKMGMKKMEEKFRTELQIHSKMRHPNIVEFHRAFTFQESTYIVLELCPNGSVKDMVYKRKCLSLPEVRRYGVQLCGAIKYLHAKNVIHRDLKMGNIFLDSEMNIKIGDFGLAAILLTEKEAAGTASRRTTLCGTPNYIAPEILERGRKGHDHKVDIWAIGVILFALLTGYPPFSDKVQEEIYRKVKSLDYTWPENGRNHYPKEVKDLVTTLLRTNAEERPEPDQIVTHPFFQMNGGSAIPSAIDPTCFASKPTWLLGNAPRGDVMDLNAPCVSILSIAEQCGVGHFLGYHQPFPSVGQGLGATIYKELLAEEAAGFTPTVPLPSDCVYIPYVSPFMKDSTLSSDSKLSNDQSISKATQSIRAIPRRPMTTREKSVQKNPTYTGTDGSVSIQRSVSFPKDLERSTVRMPSRTAVRSTRSATYERQAVQPRAVEPRGMEVRPKTISASTVVADRKTKVVSNVPENMRQPVERSKHGTTFRMLIGPNEIAEHVHETDPCDVLAMLVRMSTMISMHLENIIENSATGLIQPEISRNSAPRPHVVKWVDYTNKFGIGYILANGSIGCVFNGTEHRPSTCIIVPNAERHVMNRNNPAYTEKGQIVPRNGPQVEFLENRGEQGIERVFAQPTQFQVNIGKNGVPDKLGPVANPFDNEKRRILSLWDKFAKYMTQNLGDCNEDTNGLPIFSKTSYPEPSPSVRFYQRLGNVGIWGFGDTFQFNFPDHTKLVISIDGLIDFYHLSVTATQILKKGRILPSSALEERSVLSYPLQILLSGRFKNHKFKDVIDANDLAPKVKFARDVMNSWIANGGLGHMGKAKFMKWDGISEVSAKRRSIWVTVGMGGGDQRYETGAVKKA